MGKNIHEIRDPIHVFIRLTSDERKVVDSRPFQRLRNIHQLALTHLVYPGATHQRFEHSLGVMELATRVYDVITGAASCNVQDRFSGELIDRGNYWRSVLRMAALVHDIGHTPFSHATESFLPEENDHEDLTSMIIRSTYLQPIWSHLKLMEDDIRKLALGPAKLKDVELTDWERLLSDIIVGDAFGVDRMDYLLRDSHHAGVAYGKFDHYRLIDTMRILPSSPSGGDNKNDETVPEGASAPENSPAFELGIESGGVQSAEALLMARYFMHTQVYYHPVRLIYDIHLGDFLAEWLEDKHYSIQLNDYLSLTDIEIIHAMRKAERDQTLAGHIHAKRILHRKHFKKIYSRNTNDININPDAATDIFNELCNQLGEENFRSTYIRPKGGASDFPVQLSDGTIVDSSSKSEVLGRIPPVSIDYIFADRKVAESAKEYIKINRETIIKPPQEGVDNEEAK